MLGVSFDNVKFIFESQDKYSIFNNNFVEPEWAIDSEPMRARGIIVFSKIQLVGQKYRDKKNIA